MDDKGIETKKGTAGCLYPQFPKTLEELLTCSPCLTTRSGGKPDEVRYRAPLYPGLGLGNARNL